ncbi:hypothetical protein CPK_ORF00881 [Chlamydia pneumoniae LPCoLN]|nr:hypothetical protein CPK_ORF00881 [Chlamydia pneumoniae LPCoLN]
MPTFINFTELHLNKRNFQRETTTLDGRVFHAIKRVYEEIIVN